MQHLACIMSGNRRWARQRGYDPSYGHQEGVKSVKRAIEFCLENSIAYLSLYTFSLENFRRAQGEKSFLFQLLAHQAQEYLPELKKEGIRVCFIGDRSKFPESVLQTCQYVEQETAGGDRLQVNLLFCYGGRQELVASFKLMLADIKRGILSEEAIDQDTIAQYLWTKDIPDPDLIFRPDGDCRLSGFLLYKSAYTELYFSNCLWPEVKKEQLQEAYDYYLHCQRNFGT